MRKRQSIEQVAHCAKLAAHCAQTFVDCDLGALACRGGAAVLVILRHVRRVRRSPGLPRANSVQNRQTRKKGVTTNSHP
jgi:hypothetical protein